MQNTTTFPGFTVNQTFYLPTDISWVITRVQSFNDSDVSTAYSINTGFLLGPYNGSYTPGNGECLLPPSAKSTLSQSELRATTLESSLTISVLMQHR